MAQPDSYNLTQIGKKVRKQQKVHVVATAIDSDTSISTAENEVSIPPCADISAEQTGCNAMPPPGLEDLDPATTPTVQTLSLVASPNETWHNATKAPRAHNATTRQHAPSTPQHASSVTNSTQQLQLRVHQQQEQQQEQEQQREQQQQQQQQQQQHKCDNSEKYSGNVQAPRKVTPRPVSNVHVTKKENSMAPHVTKKASRMVWRKALPYVNKKVSYYNGEWESRTGAQNANNDDAAANNRYYNHLHRSSRKSSGTHHLTGKDGKHYTLHHTRGAKNQPMSRESWGAAVYHNRYGDAHYVDFNSTYAPRSWQNAYPVYGAAGRGRGGSKHPSLYGVEPRPPHHTPYGVEPRPPTVYDSKTIPYDEQWLGNDDDDQDVLAGSVHNRGGGAARLVPAALLPVSTPGPVEAACCELPGCDSAVSKIKITSAELLEQQITEANDRLRDKLRAARTPGELRQLLHECRSDSNPAVGWFEQQLAERKLAKLEQQLAENEHLLLKPSGDVNHLVDNDNPAEKDDAAGKTLNSTANGGIVVTLDEEVGAHSSVTESEHAGSSHGLREMDNDQLSLSISDDYKAEDKEEKMLNPEAKEFIPTGSIATATSKALVAAQYEVSREPSAGEKYYNDLRMRGQRVLERMRLQMQSVWDGAPELPVCAVSATPTPSIIGGPCKLVHSPTTELSASDDLTTLSVPATPGKQPTPIVIHSDRQLERNPLYGIPTPSHPAGTGARHVGSVVKSSVALPGATNVAAVDYVLNLCGLSKFRDILVERGYDRIDFLERALNQELEAVGMKDTEARRLRRFLKSMSGTTLNPQAAEFIPGAGRPPPQMMGQLPGAAPPPAPPPVSLTLTAPAPTTLQQHHNAATANAATLSPILSASDALRSSPSATEASVLGSASVHHPGPPSLTDDVLSQVQPVDVGTSNSTMSMTGGRHRRASEVHMEDLPTKFDFLDGRDSEDEEAKEKSDDGALVDDHEAFHGEIPDEDFDFSKSHEFDCQRKPCQRLQAADSHAEMQWGSFGFAEGDENEEETATQSRLKVFAEFSKNSDSSCHHQPLGSSLPPY